MEDEEIARCIERSTKMIRESKELIKKSQAVIDKPRRVKKPAGEIDKTQKRS